MMPLRNAWIIVRLKAFWMTPRFSRIEFYGVCALVAIMRHFVGG